VIADVCSLRFTEDDDREIEKQSVCCGVKRKKNQKTGPSAIDPPPYGNLQPARAATRHTATPTKQIKTVELTWQ
jgi:hypothetical protein